MTEEKSWTCWEIYEYEILEIFDNIFEGEDVSNLTENEIIQIVHKFQEYLADYFQNWDEIMEDCIKEIIKKRNETEL